MSFSESKWVWMDGKIVPWGEATVHVSVHGLHYGTGVFEGIRCYETSRGPAVFRLEDHLDRFFASASVYGLQIPFSKDDLGQAVRQVIWQNGYQSCYIRPICFYGSDNLGLIPDKCPVHVSILTWPWDPLHGQEARESGVRLSVSPWLKFHWRMMPTTAKACGQYLNSVLAIRDAVASGCDEALLLDIDDHVSEGSGENIFVVRDHVLITNDARHSILPGITRDSAITIAHDLGFCVETRALQLQELLSADEAFLTGTAAEIAPIRAVGSKCIGQGRRGPITESIQNVFLATVAGRAPAYWKWLSFI